MSLHSAPWASLGTILSPDHRRGDQGVTCLISAHLQFKRGCDGSSHGLSLPLARTEWKTGLSALSPEEDLKPRQVGILVSFLLVLGCRSSGKALHQNRDAPICKVVLCLLRTSDWLSCSAGQLLGSWDLLAASCSLFFGT